MIKAILDACVLYSAPVRDLLLWMADAQMYEPFWTDDIQNEWIRNVLISRTDLKEESLRSAVAAMNEAFPHANISDYSYLIQDLVLPDEKDRHVLAAAIHNHSDVIVTFNLRDFPLPKIRVFGIEVQTPDQFISGLMDLDITAVVRAFRNQLRNLKNPPLRAEQVLEILEKNGLRYTPRRLRSELKGRACN